MGDAWQAGMNRSLNLWQMLSLNRRPLAVPLCLVWHCTNTPTCCDNPIRKICSYFYSSVTKREVVIALGGETLLALRLNYVFTGSQAKLKLMTLSDTVSQIQGDVESTLIVCWLHEDCSSSAVWCWEGIEKETRSYRGFLLKNCGQDHQ